MILTYLQYFPIIKNPETLKPALNYHKFFSMVLRIVDNQLYFISQLNGYSERSKAIKVLLHELLLTHKIPNVEFCLTIDDIIPPEKVDFPFPLLTFCKRNETGYEKHVLVPDFTFGAYHEAFKHSYTTVAKRIMDYARTMPWEDRKHVAFFRGFQTAWRYLLSELSKKHPDLYDVITPQHGEHTSAYIPIQHFCNYTYLIHHEGIAYSARLKYLMMCNSTVIFSHKTDFRNVSYEFWYDLLKPYENYVPLNPSEEEKAVELILNLRENETEAQRIAYNGFKLARDSLSLDNIKCYWQQLLTEYSKRMDWVPEYDENLEDFYSAITHD